LLSATVALGKLPDKPQWMRWLEPQRLGSIFAGMELML
jgi:hypothetical protein